MKSVLILGAGMVGSAMARDLAPAFSVTAADLSQQALDLLSKADSRIQTVQADLSDPAVVTRLASSVDFVLSAVPGFMGFETLRTLILCGKPIVDISFFPENALELHDLAVKNKVTAIVDCGVAPGMDNLLLGYYNQRMQLDSFECLVGGLPKTRNWPWQYKAPFSPMDVLEEYTRPARYVEAGRVVTRPALSDPELVQFEKAGTLESFNTDGLRSIIHTMQHIPDMKEKTLRFPGHIEYVRVLRESGFLSREPVETSAGKITPLELTSKLLFREWKLQAGEPEFTVMRVTLKGKKSDKNVTVVAEVYDEYDAATQTSSMARTTGYTATAAIHLLDQGLLTAHGVFPPELIGGEEKIFRFFMEYQAQRGIHYSVREF